MFAGVPVCFPLFAKRQAAMGGELEITARFPDGIVVIGNFADSGAVSS
jgi:hypothetical protein